MNASRKGLRLALSQKQDDGCYHPVAYASRTMNETEQRYHSNKQEFLALKWAGRSIRFLNSEGFRYS